MLGRTREALQQVRERCTRHGEEPRRADAHLTAREVSEPDARAEVRREVRAVQV